MPNHRQYQEVLLSVWPCCVLLHYIDAFSFILCLKLASSPFSSPWLLGFRGYFRASLQCLLFYSKIPAYPFVLSVTVP